MRGREFACEGAWAGRQKSAPRPRARPPSSLPLSLRSHRRQLQAGRVVGVEVEDGRHAAGGGLGCVRVNGGQENVREAGPSKKTRSARAARECLSPLFVRVSHAPAGLRRMAPPAGVGRAVEVPADGEPAPDMGGSAWEKRERGGARSSARKREWGGHGTARTARRKT